MAETAKRKPLPKGATMAQRAADIQAGRSERAGHEMVRKNPPPKRSVSDIVFGAGRGIGQALRGAVFPKSETERQKKLREATRAASGAAAGSAAAGAARGATESLPVGMRKKARSAKRKSTRKSNRNSGR
jgi:hypothetical protein